MSFQALLNQVKRLRARDRARAMDQQGRTLLEYIKGRPVNERIASFVARFMAVPEEELE